MMFNMRRSLLERRHWIGRRNGWYVCVVSSGSGAAIENARLAQTAWPAATASGSQRVAWSSSRVGSEVPLATAPAEGAAGCGNGNSRKRRGCLSMADARGQTEDRLQS